MPADIASGKAGEKGNIIVSPEHENQRLDVFLAGEGMVSSRHAAQRLIDEGRVRVDGGTKKASYKVRPGEMITVDFPPPPQTGVQPEKIPLDVLYEDDDLIVINKPRGMAVHPGAGRRTGTLVGALLGRNTPLSSIGAPDRPGIVHRLDKDTSGVLVVAKNDQAHLKLAALMKGHHITRRYLALVYGHFTTPKGTISAPIGRHPEQRQKMAVTSRHSRPAVTHFRVLEELGPYSFVELQLETGRTHQIRVHMAYLQHPVLGDPKYTKRRSEFDLEGQALHAAVLGFVHPRNGEYMEFTAPLPADFQKVLFDMRELYGNGGSRESGK